MYAYLIYSNRTRGGYSTATKAHVLKALGTNADDGILRAHSNDGRFLFTTGWELLDEDLWPFRYQEGGVFGGYTRLKETDRLSDQSLVGFL